VTSEITQRPSRSAVAVAGVAGGVVPIALLAGGASGGAAFSSAGVAVLAVGVYRGRQLAVDWGALFAFLGVIVAGLLEIDPPFLLAGLVGSVVAWDVGGTAITIGEQLGREADTIRVELIHALGSATVGIAAAAIGFVLFQSGSGGQPTATLFVLLVAMALFVAALNR